MSSLVLPCLGLAPDAHAMAAPKGSMRHAENVVCDLPGVVRPRPNFEAVTNKVTAYMPRSMHYYGGTPIMVSHNGAAYRLESEAAVITGNAIPVNDDACETKFAEARGSLYYCTSTGVRALRSEAGTTTDAAGLEFPWGIQAPAPIQSSTHGPYTAPFAVAYAYVVVRTDVNGYIKRSAPSLRIEARFDASFGYVTDSLTLADGATAAQAFQFASGVLLAGDVVEVYRTTIATDAAAVLSSDMYLLMTYIVTSADVTAGFFPQSGTTFLDRTLDADLGEALYTNPQREGALSAKYPPILAQEIALWQSCVWYGRTVDRHRVTFSIDRFGLTNGSGEHFYGDTTTLGFIITTGDITDTSDEVLNVVAINGIGSTVGDSIKGTGIPAGTTIIGISGAGPYTVTMSADATATTVGLQITMSSNITVDGTTFPFDFTLGTIVPSNGSRTEKAASELAKAINALARAGSMTVYARAALNSVTIERTTLTGASFTVSSNRQLSLAGLKFTSTQDDRPDRVYYSQPDEPEAVPLLNYIDIGSQVAPIQRLIPCGNALLVFKEDGLYRITGSPPDNWSLDQLDTELRLVRPEAVAVLGDVAYAWTNRGIVEVDETGVRRSVSAGKIDTELFDVQGDLLGDASYHGCRVLTSERHGLVIITYPSTAAEGPNYVSEAAYCFAPRSGSWTKWTPLFVRCGASSSTGVLRIAVGNALGELEWETRYLLDEPRGYDRQRTIAAWTATADSTAMSITNAQRGEWVPTVGDWVAWKVGGVDSFRRIIDVGDDGGGDYSWILDAAAPSNIAAATDRYAYEGSPVLLEWLPSSMGTSGNSLGIWREVVFQMDQQSSGVTDPSTCRITFGVRHDGAITIPTVVGTPARSVVQSRPYRMGWPREGARRAVVAPRLGWSEISWPWRLSGVALVGETGSEKVRR